MSEPENPTIKAWKWWFTPRSTDPSVIYRERALRFLLPMFFLLRTFDITWKHFKSTHPPNPYAPEWLSQMLFIVPTLLAFHFLLKQKVDRAGFFFVL